MVKRSGYSKRRRLKVKSKHSRRSYVHKGPAVGYIAQGKKGRKSIISTSLWDGIFKPGDTGGVYDPSNVSTVFQDAAKTTPALDGDPVGCITCTHGVGPDLIQTTLSLRPTFYIVSDFHYLETNATGQYLSASYPNSPARTELSGFAGGRSSDSGGSAGQGLFGVNETGVEDISGDLSLRSQGNIWALRNMQNFGRILSGVSTNNPRRVGMAMTNGAAIKTYVDGVETTHADTAVLSDVPTSISVLPPILVLHGMRFYGGMVIDRDITTAEATKIDSWLAERTPT